MNGGKLRYLNSLTISGSVIGGRSDLDGNGKTDIFDLLEMLKLLSAG